MNTGILNEEYSHMLANSINHYQSIQHQETLNLLIEKSEISLVASLGLKPFKDGDKYCFLWGDNIQDGVCGFGETVHKAITDFNKCFYNN